MTCNLTAFIIAVSSVVSGHGVGVGVGQGDNEKLCGTMDTEEEMERLSSARRNDVGLVPCVSWRTSL